MIFLTSFLSKYNKSIFQFSALFLLLFSFIFPFAKAEKPTSSAALSISTPLSSEKKKNTEEEIPILGKFTTHDNLSLRTAKWPAKNIHQHKTKGTIIFVEGMGGFIEAYEGFCKWLSHKGYDVLSFDWRGQGGSDRMTHKKTLLHVNSFDDYIIDLKNFIQTQAVQTNQPLILIGMSMGGNIALRYLYENAHHPISALILLSPMIDINTTPYPYPIARGIASFASTIGAGENFVFGYDTFTTEACLSKYDPQKNGCQEKYIQDCQLLEQQPNLAVGGPSFNWLASAFHSCDKLQECILSEKLSLPILMISVENDHLVNTAAQMSLCEQIPSCQQRIYDDPEAHHNVLKDNDSILKKLMTDIDLFLHEETALVKSTSSTPR